MTDSQPRPSPVPLARRIGIVLAVLLACVAIPAAFGLLPDSATSITGSTSTTSALRTAAIAILTATSLATIALTLPAWRGSRTAATTSAALQLLAAIPFLTVQVLPPDLAPTSSGLAAAGLVVLYAAAATLVTLGVPPIVRHAAALTTAISLFSTIMVTISPHLSSGWMRAVSTLAAATSAIGFLLLVKGLHRFAGRRTRGLPDHANSFWLGARAKKLATGATSDSNADPNPATSAPADPNPTPRSVAYQLLHGPRPPELDHPGPWRTIERLASHNNAVLTLPDARPPLTAETELAIYTIITSAIANIRRHAPRATLSVSFGFTPTHVNLAVRNSLPPGTNIDATLDTSDAIGLASMLALAEELGGTAALRATPIEWLIQVTLPHLDSQRLT